MKPLIPSSMRRILIIRLSSIGDIVLTTPVLRVLRRQYPDLVIDYLVKEQFQSLITAHPAVDTVHTISKDFSFGDLLRLRQYVQTSGKYDAIIDLHDNLRSRVLTTGGKLPYVRYDKQRFYRWLYVYWKKRTPAIETYITDRYFDALAPFEISNDEQGLEFYFPQDFQYNDPSVRDEVEEFHATGNPVTLALGAAWATKEWLPERFGDVANQLINQYSASIALIGGPDDRHLVEPIQSRVTDKTHLYNFIGRTSLLESAKILEGTQLHLANDSGFTHIATAFKKKVIVVLGSTAMPIVFYPKYTAHELVADSTLGCRPCTHMGRKKCPLGHFKCMNNIETEQVLAAYNRLTGDG